MPTGNDNDALTGHVKTPEFYNLPNKCPIPPPGWYCSRTPGHEGPCAARVAPPTGFAKLWDWWWSRKCIARKHVWKPSMGPLPTKCPFCEEEELYHRPTSFHVSGDDDHFVRTWMQAHDTYKHHTGAVGTYTWEFTPAVTGTVVKVRCSCGEALDLTDNDTW